MSGYVLMHYLCVVFNLIVIKLFTEERERGREREEIKQQRGKRAVPCSCWLINNVCICYTY